MKIDYDNSGHLKLCLLCEGVSLNKKTRSLVGKKYAENRYPYGRSNKVEDGLFSLPSEIVLPNDVVVGVHLRDKAPWSIKLGRKEKMELFHRDKKIANVDFAPRPGFFDKELPDKTLCQKIVVMYGLYSLSFFNRGWCYYFWINKACKFCSLNPTRDDAGKGNVAIILPDMARQAARVAFANEKKIKHIDYSAGAHENNDLGVKLQLDLVKAVKKESPDKVRHHMLTIPPDSWRLLNELKNAGLDTIAFNIEVFDRNLFRQVCPGKQLMYGYEKYFEALKKAKEIFGFKDVYCGFVGGLEPIESLLKGIIKVSEKGYTPALNVFHADPESSFSNKAHPKREYVWRMVKAQTAMYKKYKFRPIFPGGTRNSLDTEVYRGFFA